MFTSYEVTPAAFAANLAFLPDGRLLFVESYTGQVKIYDESTKKTTMVWKVPDMSGGDQDSCLGITATNDYPTYPYIFVYCTRSSNNAVLKVKVDPVTDVGESYSVIFNATSTGEDTGGPLKYNAADSSLYLVIGDGASAGNSQNLTAGNYEGKILRMTVNGTIPNGNPYKNSLVWAFGIRNDFGLAWDPIGKQLWGTDNGPTCNDEINLYKKRGNYAWGLSAMCPNNTATAKPRDTNNSGPKPRILPKYAFPTAAGIVGLAFDQSANIIIGRVDTGAVDYVSLNKKRQVISVNVGAFQVPPKPYGFPLTTTTNPVNQAVYVNTLTAILRLVPKLCTDGSTSC